MGKKKHRCFCCHYLTITTRGEYEICPVCFWEDDGCPPNMPSGANHGLTLEEGRKNFKEFGACESSMLQHVRKPKGIEE